MLRLLGRDFTIAVKYLILLICCLGINNLHNVSESNHLNGVFLEIIIKVKILDRLSSSNDHYCRHCRDAFFSSTASLHRVYLGNV